MSGSEELTKRGWIRNVFLLLASLIVFSLVLEGIFRLFFGSREEEDKFFFNILASISTEGNLAVTGGENVCFELDDLLFWRMRKNLDDCEWDPISKEYITTNDHGLRGKNFPGVKSPDTFRILCLGDSVIYGLRIEAEDTFAACLEAELRMDRELSRNVEVVNAGVPGYSSYQGWLYLQGEGLSFEPDLIIVCFGYNDSQLAKSSDSQVRKLQRKSIAWESLSAKILHSLCQKSVFVRKLNYFLYRLVIKKGLNMKRVSPADYQENLQKIIDIAHKNGIKVILLAPPYRRVIDLSDYVERMRYVARKNDVPFVFDPIFTVQFTEKNPNLFADDAHPNAHGHALMAELLLKVIKERRWGSD